MSMFQDPSEALDGGVRRVMSASKLGGSQILSSCRTML